MKAIKDPLHDYIYIEKKYVEHIIDTECFQRLKNIRQLDTARTVYPSATHSRFEHTLGVYHLGSLAFENLKGKFRDTLENDIDDDVNDELEELETTLKAACLFHDIGHFPYSHLGEEYADQDALDSYLRDRGLVERIKDVNDEEKWKNAGSHEKMACQIVLDKYKQNLNELDVDPLEVCSFILGTSGNLFRSDAWKVSPQILNSHIDVDRLDYMLRDDMMSGASLVSVDSERFVRAYSIPGRDLALSDKALSTVGNYLDGRLQVYRWITQHHKVVYSNLLLVDMIEETLDIHPFDSEKGEVTDIPPSKIKDDLMDDIDIMSRIRGAAESGESQYLTKLYDRWRSRDYLKSCWKHLIDFESWLGEDSELRTELQTMVRDKRNEVEDMLVDHLNVEDDEVMCGVARAPGYDSEELSAIKMDVGGTPKSVIEMNIYVDDERIYDEIPYFYTNTEENVRNIKEYIKKNRPPWNL